MTEDRQPDIRGVGLVVHPSRTIDRVLEAIHAWASANEVTVGQVLVPGQTRRVAEPVEAAECDLLIALGGDGTALAALHAAAPASPVLGVACGSVGALTSASADRMTWALEQVDAGRWSGKSIPGLDVAWDEGHAEVAINDVAVLRDGPGAPGAEGIAVTPLATHGGSRPEVDGRPTAAQGRALAIRRRAGYATLVTLAEEEPCLTGLRRRGLVLDSPRVLVRESRLASEREG